MPLSGHSTAYYRKRQRDAQSQARPFENALRNEVGLHPIPDTHTNFLRSVNSIAPLLANLASAQDMRRHRSAKTRNNPVTIGETNLENGLRFTRRPLGPIRIGELAGATRIRSNFRKTPPPRRNLHRAITDLVEGQ